MTFGADKSRLIEESLLIIFGAIFNSEESLTWILEVECFFIKIEEIFIRRTLVTFELSFFECILVNICTIINRRNGGNNNSSCFKWKWERNLVGIIYKHYYQCIDHNLGWFQQHIYCPTNKIHFYISNNTRRNFDHYFRKFHNFK